MILYHFTCQDMAVKIVQDGMLRPSPVTRLLWLTDLEVPDKQGLGLTAHMLGCDRTAVRFEVDDRAEVCHRWGKVRTRFPVPWVDSIESGGRMPAHWFVSMMPVRFIAMIDAHASGICEA